MSGPERLATIARTVARWPWGNADAMRAVHWAGEALPLGTCLAIWVIGTGATAEAAWLATLHKFLGVLVLMFTALRVMWRQPAPVSSRPAQRSAVQRHAAQVSIVVLYALLVVQPLLSLTGRMLRGERITVFGNIAMPAVLSANQPLAHLVFRLQGWNALLLLVLISMHIAAALYRLDVRRGKLLPGPSAEGKARAGTAVCGASASMKRS